MTPAPARAEQVVVLAGGLGTRLSGLARRRPKVLQPVGDETFVDVMLAPLRRDGFRRFHFCLGHLGTQVQTYLATLPDHEAITSVIEPTPRGTAGALLASTDLLDNVFLLLLGDTYLDIDYAALVHHLPPDALGVMVVTSAPCGVTPNVRTEAGRVTRYAKDGVAGGQTDTGVALLRRAALRRLPTTDRPQDLNLLFQLLIQQRALAAFPVQTPFVDIGVPERYHRFAHDLSAERMDT